MDPEFTHCWPVGTWGPQSSPLRLKGWRSRLICLHLLICNCFLLGSLVLSLEC